MKKMGTGNKIMMTGKCTNPENESLARDGYLQGATSMLALLISAGMPPEFLDGMGEGIRGAKRRGSDEVRKDNKKYRQQGCYRILGNPKFLDK